MIFCFCVSICLWDFLSVLESRLSSLGNQSRRKADGVSGYGGLRGDSNASLKSHIWRCFLFLLFLGLDKRIFLLAILKTIIFVTLLFSLLKVIFLQLYIL